MKKRLLLIFFITTICSFIFLALQYENISMNYAIKTYLSNRYYRIFPMSKTTYDEKVFLAGKDLNRLMTSDFYSPNRLEELKELKKELMFLKEQGKKYEKN